MTRVGGAAPAAPPLLVIISRESGSQGGAALAAALRQLGDASVDVWSLPGDARGGAEAAASALVAQAGPAPRVLVAGGDGTAALTFSAFEAAWPAGAAPPAFAILPLGTGNDLARETGWAGAGAPPLHTDDGGASLRAALSEARSCSPAPHDRWLLALSPSVGAGAAVNAPLPGEYGAPRRFTNYLSLGFCAETARLFASARASAPSLFRSRLLNKLAYGLCGAYLLLRGLLQQLSSSGGPLAGVTLWADGAPVALPPGAQGLVLSSISYWMGGVRPWPAGGLATSPSSQQRRPSPDDGVLEVCAHTGALHVVAMQAGLAAATPVAAARTLRLEVASWRGAPLALQADGEPWLLQPGGAVEVTHAGSVLLLRRGRR